jgi:hypothetical protein
MVFLWRKSSRNSIVHLCVIKRLIENLKEWVSISREQMGANHAQLNPAIESFEPNFFNGKKSEPNIILTDACRIF